MRILALRLQKYGPFEDESIAFGQEFSVVHGPNEAGKSTLLDGLGDFLWGYSNRSHPRAFHYAASVMRLIGTVTVGGAEHIWTRRSKKLSDADENEVVPPWDPDQTGSVDEWRLGFGLDLDNLQAGGRALIEGGGDLADVVFLAETGVVIKQVREDLVGRMDKIYKERANAKCAVREVLKTIRDLTAQIEESEASAGEVADLRAKRDDIEQQKAEYENQLTALTKEVKRLEELGRCFRAAAELREVESELQEVRGSGPTLGQADAEKLAKNLDTIDTARESVQSDKSKLRQLQASLDRLELHPEVVARAGLIKDLGHRIQAAKADRALLRDVGKHESLTSAVVELLHDLGVEPVDELAAEVAGLRVGVDERDQLDRTADELIAAQNDVDREQNAVRDAELALQNREESGKDEGRSSALADARTRRDETWAGIKEPWLSGDLPAASERVEMAADLDADIRAADETAESQAEHLTAAAEARGQLLARERDLEARRQELTSAQKHLEEIHAQWDALIDERGLPRLLDPQGWTIRAQALQKLEAAWQNLERHTSDREAAQGNLDDFTDRAELLVGLLDESDDDPISRVEALGSLLTDASKAEGAGNQLKEQMADIRVEIREQEEAQKAAESAVAELADRYDEEAGVLLERSNRALKLSERLQELVKNLKSLKNPESDLKELLAELADLDEVERSARLDSQKAAAKTIEVRIGELQSELGSLASQLANLEARGSIARLTAERMSQGEELRRLVDEYRLLRLQVEMLDRYFEQAAEQTRSPVLDSAGELLSKLTLGRYVGFEIVTDENRHQIAILRRDQSGGATNSMKLSELSEGTADQVFLALRLAGIQARQEQRTAAGLPTLPVVLDDVLIAHDDQRSVAALEVLAELAADFQIILLTHHSRVLDSSEQIPGIRTVELAPPGSAT